MKQSGDFSNLTTDQAFMVTKIIFVIKSSVRFTKSVKTEGVFQQLDFESY